MPKEHDFESQIRNIIYDNRTIITYDSLSGNETYNLPPYTESYGRSLLFINATDHDLTLDLHGSDTVNGYSTDIVINQKNGWWQLMAGSSGWIGITNGWSTIYFVESESADTGLALDGTWDDVAGMTLLNGVYGYGYLSARGTQFGRDSSDPEYIYLYWGLGKTSGNNAPDISGGYDYISYVRTTANNLDTIAFPRKIVDCPYESDGSAVYMKSQIVTNEMNITSHLMYGQTNSPMGLYWRRIR